jgi:hypothetical protein
VNDELVYNFANQGKVRFFSDIAIKPDANETEIKSGADLVKSLREGINDSNISGEIDLLDDGKVSIACTSDIEALIVDNDKVKEQVITALSTCNKLKDLPRILVSELPRNDPGEDGFDL